MHGGAGCEAVFGSARLIRQRATQILKDLSWHVDPARRLWQEAIRGVSIQPRIHARRSPGEMLRISFTRLTPKSSNSYHGDTLILDDKGKYGLHMKIALYLLFYIPPCRLKFHFLVYLKD